MKVFRDSVHGYIEIPEIIVKKIVDTELFQRLRNIEQTSMRPLYPAARHDRFIHSLGVYALGVQAFKSFIKNVKAKFDNLPVNDDWWRKNYLLFTLACLLHDCAHAPFSHTYEFIYDIPKMDKSKLSGFLKNVEFKNNPSLSRLDYEMLCTYDSKNFEYDFLNESGYSGAGAPHEKLSGIMVSKEYKSALKEIFEHLLNQKIQKADYEFIARMIIGCHYKKKLQPEASIKNSIISMLNSSAIDVDGLDYIVRDSYNSGMDSWSIDYKRIIESFTLTEVTVFENCKVKSFDLSGIWFENSILVNENWKNGKVEGHVAFNDFDHNDVNCISFEANDNAENIIINEKNNLIETQDSTIANIKHEARKFKLTLKNTCKLQGEFSGTISGRFLGKIDNITYKNTKMEYALSFNKTCLSVIQSAIDARNHEYLWVYSHPKVVYNSTFLQCHLLRLSARFLCCKKNNPNFQNSKLDLQRCHKCSLSHEKEEDIILDILGLDSFLHGHCVEDKFAKIGYTFYRSCDDDLITLFKNIYHENKKREKLASDQINKLFPEYFSRSHKKPIWKSFIEFKYFFGIYTSSEQKDLMSLSRKITQPTSPYKTNYGFVPVNIQKALSNHGIKDAVCVKSKLKTKELNPYATYLIFDKSTVRLCDVMDKSILKNKFEKEFFYIFGDIKNSINYSDIPQIVQAIKDVPVK